MFLVDEIKNAVSVAGKVCVVSDLDGVVAEYRLGEGKYIKNNVAGIFENKRPIKTAIKTLELISKIDGVELYIASSCFFEEQCQEKNRWLDKYMPFIRSNNRFFVKRDFELENEMIKLNVINEQIIQGGCCTFLIDDSHTFLFRAMEEFDERVRVFHVSSLID